MIKLSEPTLVQRDKTIKDDKIDACLEKFKELVRNGGYTCPESFVNLLDDKNAIKGIKSLKNEKVTNKLKYIIVCGMGGSVTGTKAIYDTCFGFYDTLEPERFPKIVFVDSLDANLFALLQKLIKKNIHQSEEILVIIVSKSGNTLETVLQGEILGQILKENVSNFKERLAIITDKNSSLFAVAEREEISILTIPNMVGGRYSTFSSVSLFPLSCAGIDIDAIVAGALEARENSLSDNLSTNRSFVSVSAIFEAICSGKNIHDLFFFHSALESLGKWCRSLYSESLGKLKNRKGEEKHFGFTTTVSIGPADLHSTLQLNLGGPINKFTTFVSTPSLKDFGVRRIIGLQEESFPVYGKNTEDVLSAIKSSVLKVYANKKLPFIEIKTSDVSEKFLGEFMMMKMMETVYLAELMDVNAFDQPEVEVYKKEAEKILSAETN